MSGMLPGGTNTHRIRTQDEKEPVMNASQLIDGINFLKFEFILLEQKWKNAGEREIFFDQTAQRLESFYPRDAHAEL